MGGRLLIFSAYTPPGFSALGGGSGSLISDIIFLKVPDTFSILLSCTCQNVFFGFNDVAPFYTHQTDRGFEKVQKFSFFRFVTRDFFILTRFAVFSYTVNMRQLYFV